MRNAFAKRFAAVLMGLGMLAALPVTGASAAEKTFTVTFYGGEYGVYSQDYVEYLEGKYGPDNVGTKASGNAYSVIAVKIPANGDLPELPTTTSTETSDPQIASTNADYGVLSDWIYSGSTEPYVAGEECMSNYSITPEFYLRDDTDVQYTLRFLLEGTEQQVAPTEFGTAPANVFTTTGLNVSAPNNLAEYTLNVQATLDHDSSISYANGTFTVKKSGEISNETPLEFVFYYTQNEHVTSTTQYEDGGTVVEYNDVTVAAGGAATTGGAAAGGAAGGTAAGGTATGGAAAGGAAGGAGAAAGGDQNAAAEAPQAGGEEAIGDNETPQAGGEESIGEGETPLAGSESGGVNVPLVAGGVAAVVIIAAIVAVVIRKRGNGAN